MVDDGGGGIVYAGIDEAGYGPRLGPLCVAMTVFRVAGWADGDPPPDMWRLLRPVVVRTPPRAAGAAARVPVDDSKRLKLANSVKTRHPLTHLEAGVLPFLACMGRRPASDRELLAALGAAPALHAWYAGDDLPAPVSTTADRVAILANALAERLASRAIETLDMRCRVIGEGAFNEGVRAAGSKAAVSFGAVAELLRSVWDRFGQSAPRVVVDRQGGRQRYGDALRGAIPGAEVRTLGETEPRSTYEVSAGARRMVVHFEVESERRRLPAALASMTAKLVREAAMARFNRYWCARIPTLAPTAGYGTDAGRWLADAGPMLARAERAALVRLA